MVLTLGTTALTGIGINQDIKTAEAAVIKQTNASIADYALKFVGTHGGQCRQFVNNVMAHFGISTGGGAPNDYFVGFEKHGPTRITDATKLVKGDIVQYGKNENAPGLHTFIIVNKVSVTTSTWSTPTNHWMRW